MIFLLRLILNYMLCSYIYILHVHYIYIVQVNVYGFGYRYVFEKVYMFTRDIWLFCVVVICNFVCICIHVCGHLKVWTYTMNGFY